MSRELSTSKSMRWRWFLSALSVTTFAGLLFACVAYTPVMRADADSTPSREYRTLDELLAIHLRDGWQVIEAPGVERRYRGCGAIGNDLPHPDQDWIEGAFHAADGRRRRFRVEWPDGYGVYVEGLDPEDGGELQYAVLTRPFAFGADAANRH